MPDYGEILRFLAQNPPKLDAERRVHASLLELLGACLRDHGSDVVVLENESKTADSKAIAELQLH